MIDLERARRCTHPAHRIHPVDAVSLDDTRTLNTKRTGNVDLTAGQLSIHEQAIVHRLKHDRRLMFAHRHLELRPTPAVTSPICL